MMRLPADAEGAGKGGVVVWLNEVTNTMLVKSHSGPPFGDDAGFMPIVTLDSRDG